jgi:hypothetical protein
MRFRPTSRRRSENPYKPSHQGDRPVPSYDRGSVSRQRFEPCNLWGSFGVCCTR